MRSFLSIWARLTAILRKKDLDREFSEEAKSHIELATEDYVQRGMPEAEARRLARVKFGALEAAKDAHRDSRGVAWLEGLFYDLRFALRGLRRDRMFTITAAAMLALVIGLNATVFTVMHTMLFGGFPLVKRNNRLVYMQERGLSGCCLSYPDFEDWRKEAQSFEGMAFVSGKSITLSDAAAEPGRRTSAVPVSWNLFRLLGVTPALGRDFEPADETAGPAQVAILSHRAWERQFGNRPDIVGHTIYVNRTPVTVVGVMPEPFTFPEQQDLWIPLEHTPQLRERAPAFYLAVGRLKDGATIEGARAEVETVGRRLARDYPATNRDVVPRVESHSQFFIGPDAPVIYGSLWASAWLVLLIACANLANLTLARTLGRSREFSTRIALGAGRARMARQILMESLLLAAAGGGLGWWIAAWGVRTWAAATESRYQVLEYRFDGGTVAYVAAVTLAASILFSVIPVVRISRTDVNLGLKSDGRGMTQGARGKHLAAALVAAQMALATILLAGAGLLVRSFANVVTADVGVRAPENVVAGWVDVPAERYATAESRLALFRGLRSRLREIPGVEADTIANTIPVNIPGTAPFELASQPLPGVRSAVLVRSGAGYFHTLGVPTIGRDFQETDGLGNSAVAIVNQSFAARYWPGRNAVGQSLRLIANGKPGAWRTVVGVAGNIMQGDPTRQTFLPVIYLPFQENPATGAELFVRTNGRAEPMLSAIRAGLLRVDRNLSLEDFTSLKASYAFRADRMDIEHVEMGKHAAVAPVFAGIALVLAALGLYAVIARSVSQRTKEIGIRIAIGAAAADIRTLIFREGMAPVLIGMLIGLVASLGVNRILQSQLVGVSPYDPVTFSLTPAVLVLVAFLGCRLPARRAMRVDPAVALRHD